MKTENYSRRRFLKESGSSLAITLISGPALLQTVRAGASVGQETRPWFRRALRWGQTNINELDPKRYDIDWWRGHWKRTEVQGLVINAGGIVAYYPSKLPLQYRAQYLGDRDLYGELTRAAHEDGIAVLARMDSNRAHEAFYQAHPDWFAVAADGKPYRAGDRYISCIDGPYYSEYLPEILREVIAWEKPEGFTDNSWSGLGRRQICYCEHSREAFRNATGKELPVRPDWNDAVYRDWIEWSYARRVQVWELNNRTVQQAGGSECVWLGMIGGDLTSQGASLRDVKAICERSEVIMLDDQGRDDSHGFQENAEIGKRLHGLLGWDKIIPESMAQYQRSPTFRKAAPSEPEAVMWMVSGFAGQIQPWWHHVGAYQWDRRQFATAIPICRWHAENEAFLVNRQPLGDVGVLYSQQNADYFGRDNAEELVARPYYGFIQALVRSRIPYLPVHADHLDRESAGLSAIVLPNMGSLTNAQIESVRRFVAGGGGLIATGETGLYDAKGERRLNFELGKLLGIRHTGKTHGSLGGADTWSGTDHSYLRLLPDLGREVNGPLSGDEPVVSRKRHDVLAGFGKTDILAFGGRLLEVEAFDGAEVPVTFIPHFDAYPPETSWMRVPRTKIPGLVLRSNGVGRCAYLPADIDRRFMRDNLPDHGRLLANVVRWTARGRIRLRVEGSGLIDCHLYRQENRLILHVVNLTSAGSWRSPVHELIPVGPFTVSVRVPEGVRGDGVRLLVSKTLKPTSVIGEWVTFQIDSVASHEVAVIQ